MYRQLFVIPFVLALAACGQPSGNSNSSQSQNTSQSKVDATGMMPCSVGQPSYDKQCAWSVVRTQPGVAATITITPADGGTTVLEFNQGDFTSPGGTLEYVKQDDFWLVNRNDREFYRFADAVISGG